MVFSATGLSGIFVLRETPVHVSQATLADYGDLLTIIVILMIVMCPLCHWMILTHP